jgi:hypothetical protein
VVSGRDRRGSDDADLDRYVVSWERAGKEGSIELQIKGRRLVRCVMRSLV